MCVCVCVCVIIFHQCKCTSHSPHLTHLHDVQVMVGEEEVRLAQAEVGPISLDFEVPMYVCSGMAIRFLRCLDRGRQYSPFRWVRYITHRFVSDNILSHGSYFLVVCFTHTHALSLSLSTHTHTHTHTITFAHISLPPLPSIAAHQ